MPIMRDETWGLICRLAETKERIEVLMRECGQLAAQIAASETRAPPPPEGNADSVPARVLQFLSERPTTAFTPLKLAAEMQMRPRTLRTALLRLAAPKDGRLTKLGRGAYKFASLTKNAA